MKLRHSPSHDWPLEIDCPHCGAGLTVDSPSDLNRHRVFNYPDKSKETMMEPNVIRTLYIATCMWCNKDFEVPEKYIPKQIRNHVITKF